MCRIKLFLLMSCISVCVIFVFMNIEQTLEKAEQIAKMNTTRYSSGWDNKTKNSRNGTIGILNDDKKIPENKLGSLENFSFVLNRDICGSEPVDLLILVGTKPDYWARRDAFRLTWRIPERPYKIKVAFFVGIPDDKSMNENIVIEHLAYGDIIQGNFRDHYHNVTTRDLTSFRWAWKYCPQAKYVMHADDDVVLDVDYIYRYLEREMPRNEDFVACFQILAKTKPFRTGHWAVSKEEYNETYYEDYCQGWAYWMTIGAAQRLDEMSFQHRPYWMNDAYLTGTLVKAIGWKHRFINLKFTTQFQTLSKFISGEYDYKVGITEDNELRRKIHELYYVKYHELRK